MAATIILTESEPVDHVRALFSKEGENGKAQVYGCMSNEPKKSNLYLLKQIGKPTGVFFDVHDNADVKMLRLKKNEVKGVKENITSVKTWFEKGAKAEEFFAFSYKDDKGRPTKVFLCCVIGKGQSKFVRFQGRVELDENGKVANKNMFILNKENFMYFITLLKDYCLRYGEEDIFLEAEPSIPYEKLDMVVVATDFWKCTDVRPLHERRDDKTVFYSGIGIRNDGDQRLFFFKQPGKVGEVTPARVYSKFSQVACIGFNSKQVDNILVNMPVLTGFMRETGTAGIADIDEGGDDGKMCMKWGLVTGEISYKYIRFIKREEDKSAKRGIDKVDLGKFFGESVASKMGQTMYYNDTTLFELTKKSFDGFATAICDFFARNGGDVPDDIAPRKKQKIFDEDDKELQELLGFYK